MNTAGINRDSNFSGLPDSFVAITHVDCAPRTLLVRAPLFTRFDIGLTKRFPIHGSMDFELRADVLNVFDNVNFTPPTLSPVPAAASFFQVTSAYTDLNNTFDPGGRLGQLVFRLNW